MAHHGDQPFFEQEPFDSDFMKQFIKQKEGNISDELGATGSFPNGKLNANDEGEIAIGITKSNGTVVIDFGKPVHWIGFTSVQAIQIGENLIKKGVELRKELGL